MSSNLEYDRILSEPELVDWLKEQPRTFGWSALIAYDRFQANRLLLQEYIARHSSEQDAFERITGKMVLAAGKHWSYMNDVVLDAPRLSFERSTVDNSLATLTLRIAGGSHMTVTQMENAPKKVERIDWYDPLQGPKLIAGVRLNDADGSVHEDGRVRLFLGESGLDIRLTLGTSDNEQEQGGRFFQQIFDTWPEDKKYLVLNEFDEIKGAEFLNPDQFRIRGIPAPGAALRASGTYGDGAVACFVSAAGSEVGLTPDKESHLMYLIPSGRSSTVLIGNYYLIKTLIGAKAHSSFYVDLTFDSDNPMAAITKGVVLHKRIMGFSEYDPAFPGFDSLSYNNEVSFAEEPGAMGEFTFGVGDGAIKVEWTSSTEGAYSQFFRNISTSAPNSMTVVDTRWDYRRIYHFEPTPAGGIRLVENEAESRTNIEIIPVGQVDEVIEDSFGTIKLYCENVTRKFLNDRVKWFVDTTSEIEMLRLHGLLFQSDVVVNLKSAHFPCDLAVFGDLAPGMTSFAVEPMEDVLTAGSSLTLRTAPAQAEVDWKVERVIGFGGGLGSITAAGVYTAPAHVEFEGPYTMVRVTASTISASSSALMRIVRRSVLVNPLVVTASDSSGRIQMSGGTVDGGSLTWSVNSVTGAVISDVPPAEGEYDESERFYVPGTGSSGEPFSVDEVTVTNPRSGDSHTSYVLRIEQKLSGTITSVSDGLPAGKLQLVFDNNLGPIDGVTWTVIAGAGAVDARGMFTVDESSPHSFAIVTAYFLIPQVSELVNYIILPIPLIDLEQDGPDQ